MKKLFVYLKDYKKECILAPLFKMLEASFELLVPLVMAAIIDRGIAKGDTTFILQRGLILIGLGLIGLGTSITAQYYAAKAAVGFATKLRHSLFSHIQNFSFTEVDTLGTSTLMTRMTSDVNQVQNGVNMVLRLFLRSPFIVFGAMVMAFTVDVKAALIFVVVIPALGIVVGGITYLTIPLYKKVQGQLDLVLRATRENLTGVRVIRAFAKEADEIEKFEEKNMELNHMQKYVGRISALMNPVTYILINAATLVLIYTGALRVEGGILTQGAVVALVNYMSQILVELVKLANLVVSTTKAIACANRISSVLEEQSSMADGTMAAGASDSVDAKIHFEHVSLKYKGASEESLSDIDFSVKRGQTLGIIGGTGSGKSSVVNLIPRFYDVTEGRILIDGVDVRDYKAETLRQKIGIVMQKAVLFKGTIRSNLLWGNEKADDRMLMEALRIAQAEEFVMQKDGQLDAAVSQNGKNFSGGQKQRLTIARAVVRRPEILILDDSASALDFATDAALRKAIREMGNDTTVIIVSQRTSSIQYADRIVVLEDGHMAGLGTHEELLESCEVYQEIYYSQFPKEKAVGGAES